MSCVAAIGRGIDFDAAALGLSQVHTANTMQAQARIFITLNANKYTPLSINIYQALTFFRQRLSKSLQHKLLVTNFHNERSLFPLQLAIYSLGLILRLVVDHSDLALMPPMCVTWWLADNSSRHSAAGLWQQAMGVASCNVAAAAGADWGLRIAFNCIKCQIVWPDKQHTTWPNLELPSGKCKPTFQSLFLSVSASLWSRLRPAGLLTGRPKLANNCCCACCCCCCCMQQSFSHSYPFNCH